MIDIPNVDHPHSTSLKFFLILKESMIGVSLEQRAPLLKYLRLTLTKLKGGVGLPKLQKYFWACQI